jgi:hypothetical protein
MLMKGVDEKDAQAVLKMGDAAKRQIISLIEKTELEPSTMRRLIDTVKTYWADRSVEIDIRTMNGIQARMTRAFLARAALPQKKGAE